MKYGVLRKKALGHTCRRCINEKYHLKLERKNCMYARRPGMCTRCRQARNIVIGVRPLSRWRVWFRL